MELSPETTDRVLTILTWCVLASSAAWIATSIIGFFYRRAYNLTHAESGSSKNITPDFMKVDSARRRDQVARGKAYDATLEQREAPDARPPTPVETASIWARAAALSTALLTLVATVFGTVTRVDAIESGIQSVGSIDTFLDVVAQHKVGAAVALAVIGSHLVVFARSSKKSLTGK